MNLIFLIPPLNVKVPQISIQDIFSSALKLTPQVVTSSFIALNPVYILMNYKVTCSTLMSLYLNTKLPSYISTCISVHLKNSKTSTELLAPLQNFFLPQCSQSWVKHPHAPRVFSHYPHPIHEQVLLVLSTKWNLNQTSFYHHDCYNLDPSHPQLLPG